MKQLHPGGLIKQISMLGPFWVVHQYDGLLGTLRSIGLRERDNLFVFTYDWRYSNLDNAKKLKTFIEATPKLRGREFDIIAHSMGGLIARIYIHDAGSANRVKRLINLAVPALGSMNALATMSVGWGGFENLMAGGIDTVRRVIFSFPSIYELFPRYPTCCRIGNEKAYTSFDPTDAKTWAQGDWIPSEHRTPARMARLKEALANAKTLKTILAEGLPRGVEETYFVGDRLATNYYLYVDPSAPSWRRWRFKKFAGDGTVPIWSAANSFDLTKSLPSFVDHATIFDDRWVAKKLTLMLNKNSGPPPVSGPGGFLASTETGETVSIDMVETGVDRTRVIPGETSRVLISVKSADELKRGELLPVVTTQKPDGTKMKLKVVETTTDQDLSDRSVRFLAVFTTEAPGVYSTQVSVPGLGQYVTDVLALFELR